MLINYGANPTLRENNERNLTPLELCKDRCNDGLILPNRFPEKANNIQEMEIIVENYQRDHTSADIPQSLNELYERNKKNTAREATASQPKNKAPQSEVSILGNFLSIFCLPKNAAKTLLSKSSQDNKHTKSGQSLTVPAAHSHTKPHSY